MQSYDNLIMSAITGSTPREKYNKLISLLEMEKRLKELKNVMLKDLKDDNNK